MDVTFLIKQRLSERGLGQKDLATAAQVTESYISQLLARKKAPPAPARTDIYSRIAQVLELPVEELEHLAEVQRQEELKKQVAAAPAPLFADCRQLVLNKCAPGIRDELRRLFEKDPFGELERLVTQTILDVAQGVAREELRSEEWLRSLAHFSGRSYEQMRVAVLEFLDTDVYHVTREHCGSFLEPMLEVWSIDLPSFHLEVMLNRRLSPKAVRRFSFREYTLEDGLLTEPGLEEFLRNPALSRDATEEEIAFLRRLRFHGRRPSALYFYREWQNLRDPLHFTESAPAQAGGWDRKE